VRLTMLTGDTSLAANARTLRWALDRLDLVCETQAIESELAILEPRYGRHADFDDVRRRLQRVRGVLLAQLRHVLTLGSDDGWVLH
jgi:hypothetical protein